MRGSMPPKSAAPAREPRPGTQMPTPKQMDEARDRYTEWDQDAYEKIQATAPTMQKNSRDFIKYLVLKEHRPPRYKKGDCVISIQILVFLRSADFLIPCSHCLTAEDKEETEAVNAKKSLSAGAAAASPGV